jgi:hypothetical protein
MKDILLSLPLMHFYLVLLVVLLIGALWPRDSGGLCRVAPLTVRQRFDGPSRPIKCPFTGLQASLSASYATRVERAIRTIRVR